VADLGHRERELKRQRVAREDGDGRPMACELDEALRVYILVGHP
jgi:hypothetical protein